MEDDKGRPRTNPRAITVVLIVLVIVGVVYSLINILDMRSELDRLELDHAKLQVGYNFLEAEHRRLEDNYESLQHTFTQLQLSHNELESENADLRTILQQYEQVPNDYYYSGGFAYHSNTYAELCNFLDYEFQPTLPYERSVFDCTESSAYVEWALENAGFDAKIAGGATPWSQTSGFHSWVIVNTQTQQVAIEATIRPRIVHKDQWDVTTWQNYQHGYYALYENIYEAIRFGGPVWTWNWWEVI